MSIDIYQIAEAFCSYRFAVTYLRARFAHSRIGAVEFQL